MSVTITVGAAGDYPTVQDAVDAIPADPAVDYIVELIDADNLQTTTLNLSKSNANNVQFTLRAATSVAVQGLSRAEGESKARIVVAAGRAVENGFDWDFEGIYFETTASGQQVFDNLIGCTVNRCIIVALDTFAIISNGFCTMMNTVIYSGASALMWTGQTLTAWQSSVYHGSGFGMWGNSGTVDANNCRVDGGGFGDFAGSLSGDCNLSSDATAPGANSFPSTAANYVDVTYAAFDLAITDPPATNPCTQDPTSFNADLATDIEGDPRGATPEPGADEPFTNSPPVISYTTPQNVVEGQVISIFPTNTGGASTDWTDEAGGFALPPGLLINPVTGEISGTIDMGSAGTYTSREKATNAAGDDTFDITWNVAQAPPVISYESGRLWLFAGHGKTTTFLPANTGGDCDDFSSIGTAFPSGVSLNLSTGLITVDPTAALGTTAGLQVRGTNSGGDGDSQIMTLVVLPHLPTGGYSFAPDERIDTSKRLGIDAWDPDLGEVRRIEVSINGGASFNITARTLDTETGVWDFGFTLLAALYADGPVTIDATIVPYDGDSRVLPQITVHANSGGTLTPALKTRYCATTGNDANSGVSPALACRTPGKAAERIQLAFGDCGNGTVICAAGDYGFIEGATIALTTTTGKLEFKPDTGATVRWTDGSFSNAGATRIKTTDIAIFKTDLLANPANGAYLHLNGNTVCTGFGQISGAVTFAGTGNWTGGLYVTGYPVDWSAIGRGDTAAYRLAAETKYVIFQETAGFPFATTLKQNWWARVTSKDCGVQFDHVVQNMIDDSIDATGSLFHPDVVHLFDTGGDINVLVHGGVCSECSAQSFFSRNGAVSANNPDCNVAFVNVCIRKPDATAWNGQWIRSTSNICWDFCALPNQAQLIDDDVGTPIENHMQGTRIRGTVFAGFTFTTIGEKYVVDRNHFMSGTFGTNCTTGGTETTQWTDPANDDYSVVVGSDIENANTTLVTGLNHDALGRPRYEGGAIGPFTSEADVPPAQASSDGYLRSYVPWGTPHWRTPTRR